MRFDLLSLQLFVAVCEEQSIAKAADREHIAASAVSKRMSDLEARLNTPLFHRSSKGLELTASAHTLLHHSRVLMRDLNQMEIELAHHASGVSGQVRVYASVSTIIQHLPDDLRDFLARHSAIRIVLQEGTSQQAVEAVAENAADIGIFGGVVPRQGLKIFPYRADRLVVLLPLGHPLGDRPSLRFADLPDYDLIGPTKGSFLDSLVLRAASDLSRPLKMPVRVNGFETVRGMVEAELGVGLVPEGCAARYVTGGKLKAIELDEPWAVRQWNICVQDGQSLPSPVKLLLKHLTKDGA
ncbi:LysR family transcriptional regulator [Labrys monachus]|uniref:DNA-binding transcriptional LysR family regulator n=1 Tax=Labrys monachus TaxID=217067 RepID=A0ABU0FG84_9HYPH|nr:LysR family transcriptional regulator [Labrys monachus]MDQ0393626.1 DNA-binding transcriptional LysR family regulator [Labrys monachus]